MNNRIKKCPVCNKDLEIIEYHCPECDISIRGRFAVSALSTLDVKQQEFVRVFLCNNGNIKDVEKVLGISYPTVKSRLAQINRILCPDTEKAGLSRDVLEKIDSGEITVSDALDKLEKGR